MSQQKPKGALNSVEFYRLATLGFAGAAIVSFIVLYLAILTDKANLFLEEVVDLQLGFVLLVFTLLFAIAYMLSVRRVRLNEASQKKPAQEPQKPT